MKRIISIGLIFLSTSGWAAKVVGTARENGDTALVKFAHYGQVYYHWVINDLVCLSRSLKNSIVCGRVAQYDNTFTVVRLAKINAHFEMNEDVKILYSKTRRSPASPGETSMTSASPLHSRALTTIGLGTGFSYLLFEGQVQYGLTKKVTLGLTVPFASTSDGTNVTQAVGGVLNGAYYLTERFSGYLFEAGIGAYSITRSTTLSAATTNDMPLMIYSTFGWKGKINRGRFNLGISGGLQYVAGSSTYSSVFTDFNGLLPLLKLTAGVEF
ncbi:MAG: hypothetical protein HYR96_05280 [Deltaproteobacteria bacterium]|nr:hypothetical protein [Deltaproteobacteria bacterium]